MKRPIRGITLFLACLGPDEWLDHGFGSVKIDLRDPKWRAAAEYDLNNHVRMFLDRLEREQP